MSTTNDEDYFCWLVEYIGWPTKNSRPYWDLMRILYTKEFVWIIPNDDNRAEDGRQLRRVFVDNHDVDFDVAWLSMGCSMLEMLIGLSEHIAFLTSTDNIGYWFWEMLDNISIGHIHDDRITNTNRHRIDDALDTVIWRLYSRNGFDGGLFPITNNRIQHDQRKVELWYQMQAYFSDYVW